MCLTPVEDLAPERIREIRMRENASQAVFARYLNVTAGLVSQWERGEKRPRGASLKLLTCRRTEGAPAAESSGPLRDLRRDRTAPAPRSTAHRVAARSIGLRLNSAKYAVGRFFFMSRNR